MRPPPNTVVSDAVHTHTPDAADARRARCSCANTSSADSGQAGSITLRRGTSTGAAFAYAESCPDTRADHGTTLREHGCCVRGRPACTQEAQRQAFDACPRAAAHAAAPVDAWSRSAETKDQLELDVEEMRRMRDRCGTRTCGGRATTVADLLCRSAHDRQLVLRPGSLMEPHPLSQRRSHMITAMPGLVGPVQLHTRSQRSKAWLSCPT